MRVLLDTTSARAPSGTAVYVAQLARALREQGVEVVETANERRGAPGTGSWRNLASDVAFTHAVLPRRARAARADLVHHPLPVLIPRRAGVAQVVTVHDLAFEALPEAFDRRFAAFARRAHRLAARRADAVIAVSAATARDVEQRWGVRANVAQHGPGQVLGDVRRRAAEHLLYVGDAEPRKDLPVLLAAYAAYRFRARHEALPLVLAGTAYAVDSGVRVVERPSREQLADLHAAAAALVHPSRHEGFGLTVAEALAAGTPVIAADTPALREIAPHARFFPPGDAGALTEALLDPPAAAPPAPQRSWADSARAHIAAYRLALHA